VEQIFLFLPQLLGLDPEVFTLYLVVLVTASNVTAKLIPESSTGWLATVRKVCAFIGVNLANRITPNVTSRDVGKAVAAGIPDEVVKEAAAQLPTAVATGQGTNAFAAAVVDVGLGHTQPGCLDEPTDMPTTTDPFSAGRLAREGGE
jgi:hypothetical protein